MLKRHIMTDLGQEYCELLVEGHLNSDVREMMNYKIRCEYDSEIWEFVDSEANEFEMEFDDFLYEIVEEVEGLGNYYYDNITEED